MDLKQLTRLLLWGPRLPAEPMGFREAVELLRPWPVAPLERAGIKPGLYHYMRESSGAAKRLHLRVDGNGHGLLLANATAAAQLLPSGVIIAKGLLDGDERPVIVDRLVRCFRGVTVQAAADDVREIERIVEGLAVPGNHYPILNLADPAYSPKVAVLERPFSADVPLAAPERLLPILDRLWELGIPHVTFITTKEGLDAAALVRAVERAEDLGLIAGVRGRGSDLAQGTLIKDLAQAGVDHIDVLYLSANPRLHDLLAEIGDHARAVAALSQAEANDVCPVAQICLVESTLPAIDETLPSLAALGVQNACFFAVAAAEHGPAGGAVPAGQLVQAARLVEEAADRSKVRYLWYPPVRFRPGESLAAQVCRGPRCSGDAAVRIGPDGSVIPARGPNRAAGNLLSDSWEAIAGSPVYRAYQERIASDTHCDDCPGLAICAADCPRNPAGWADE